MSNGSSFLWVIRVLETVGAQIRAVGRESGRTDGINPLF